MKPRVRWSDLRVLRVVLIALMLRGVVLVGFGFKMLADTRRFLGTAVPQRSWWSGSTKPL